LKIKFLTKLILLFFLIMKAIFFLSFLTFSCLNLRAQTDPLTQVHGARNQSLGNIRIFDPSAFSHFNNPGSLVDKDLTQIAAGYDHRFGIAELSSLNLASAFSLGPGRIGFGVARFGGKLFNQQTLGISFGNQIGIVSIGGKLEWFQTQIEGFGTGNAAIFSLGGVIDLIPDFSLGATISNLNRAKFGRYSDHHLPTGISLGVRYQPNEHLQFFGEVEKDILLNPFYKLGLEYNLRDWIDLRTGLNSNPGRLFFGLGLDHENFGFDLGYGRINPLGSTTHFSVTYDLFP
jgi:hypothetical protein